MILLTSKGLRRTVQGWLSAPPPTTYKLPQLSPACRIGRASGGRGTLTPRSLPPSGGPTARRPTGRPLTRRSRPTAPLGSRQLAPRPTPACCCLPSGFTRAYTRIVSFTIAACRARGSWLRHSPSNGNHGTLPSAHRGWREAARGSCEAGQAPAESRHALGCLWQGLEEEKGATGFHLRGAAATLACLAVNGNSLTAVFPEAEVSWQ